MRPHLDDRELLSLEIATGFVLNHAGRMLHANAPDRSVAPRLYLGGCTSGNLVRFRQDVGNDTAHAIERLIADEPPLLDANRTPRYLDDYVELLAAEAPVQECSTGLAWSFPDRLADQARNVQLIVSETPEGTGLLARLSDDGMPTSLVDLGFGDVGEFWAPWCIALDEQQIASIAFAARLGPRAAATGVMTVPRFRGRGFAAAATAGWAAHPGLRGFTLFYGTSRSNTSSQRVAERLALRYLGASLSIT